MILLTLISRWTVSGMSSILLSLIYYKKNLQCLNMNHSKNFDIFRKVQCLGRKGGGKNDKGTETLLELFERRLKCQPMQHRLVSRTLDEETLVS